MTTPSRFATCSCAVLVLAIALPVTAPRAASDDGTRPEAPKAPKSIMDIPIPIPHEPDAANNGCRLRQSPMEGETGALTEVPFWSLVEHDNLRYAIRLDEPETLSAALAPLDPDSRTLALLFALWYNFGRDGLHTFFFLSGGSAAPQIRDALRDAGLARELDIFSRAMALFGKDYPLDPKRREAFFGWSKPGKRVDAVTTIPAPLNAFDHRMFALSDEFGTKADFKKVIIGYVNGRPVLWQRIEAERARLNEPDRLMILTSALGGKLGNLWRPYGEIERRLESLSRQERALVVMDAFNEEFKNGGVEQFFYNSEGALAPDVYDAMIELGMTEQAAILKRGLDMFGKSYIRDTERRRDAFFRHDGSDDLDKRLSGLTDELYALDGGLEFHRIGKSMEVEGGPGIDFAMLKYARQNKLLPC